jgi:TRAP transporter 4TM/12TM fusion protein
MAKRRIRDLEDGEHPIAMEKESAVLSVFTNVFSFLFACFILLTITVWLIDPFEQRMAFLAACLMLVFLLYPFRKGIGKKKGTVSFLDYLLFAMSLLVGLYLVLNFRELADRVGDPTQWDIIFGIILGILVLEATRRVIGWVMVILAIVFIIYGFVGSWIPGPLGHRGMSLDSMISNLSLTLNGFITVPIQVIIWYVVPFIIFGSFLTAAGTVDFFSELANTLVGWSTGGPAKISCVSSALFGTVSGSAVANVMVDGWLTIPMMIKTGFKPKEFAAAVEAVASTGGQLMPPVMGAAAFLMAEFLGVPYLSVIKVAIVPAVLYYVALYASVHFQAQKLGLGYSATTPKEVFVNLIRLLKSRGYMLIPIFILIAMIIWGYSPTYAAILSLVAVVVLSFISKEYRMTPKKIVKALEQGGKSSLGIVAAGGCAGAVISVTLSSGLGLKISELVIAASGGHLIFILIFTAIASLIFGMGLPSAVCYILLATLVAPAIVKTGVIPIQAHLYIFYFGMLAMITPPVAYAAYAAATIVDADIMMTGVWACRIALSGILLPFAFVYGPALSLIGKPLDVVFSVVTALFGVICLSGANIGYFNRREIRWLDRILLAVAAVSLVWVSYLTSLFGLILLSIVFIKHGGIHMRLSRDSSQIRKEVEGQILKEMG